MIDSINKKYFLIAVSSALIGKITDDDIAVRCPVCGDSQKKKNSTRLHLYHSNGNNRDYVNCFNGDCSLNSPRGVYSFLKDFYPSLIDGYKRENFTNTIENLSKTEDVFKTFKKKVDIKTYDLSQFFIKIEDSQECLDYISGRGLEYNKEKYGQWYYGITDIIINDTMYKINNSVIIPLYYEGEMYGFYSRSIDKKDFYTYMDSANTGFKIWNWFNIDKTKPVYIFEGIFDAIASGLDNSIALMGAKIPNERLDELDNPVFVLDNDKTGIKNAIFYSDKYNVFVQPDDILQKDMNEILTKTNINPSTLIKENIFRGISAQTRLKPKL